MCLYGHNENLHASLDVGALWAAPVIMPTEALRCRRSTLPLMPFSGARGTPSILFTPAVRLCRTEMPHCRTVVLQDPAMLGAMLEWQQLAVSGRERFKGFAPFGLAALQQEREVCYRCEGLDREWGCG